VVCRKPYSGGQFLFTGTAWVPKKRTSERALKTKLSHSLATKAKQDRAEGNVGLLSDAIGVANLPDNEPMDILWPNEDTPR
jgi:hypothetical protein